VDGLTDLIRHYKLDMQVTQLVNLVANALVVPARVAVTEGAPAEVPARRPAPGLAGRTILVVDDERSVREILSEALEEFGYAPRTAEEAAAGFEVVRAGGIDLVMTDIEMPGENGIELLGRIKRHDPDLDVVMVTGVVDTRTAIAAIRQGANDYLTKPFNVRELVARVRAILRRVERLAEERQSAHDDPLVFDDLAIDRDKRRVIVRGQQVHLTAKEFDLLYHFATHPGRVFTRSQLLDAVCGYAHDGYEHTVNTHINRLRRKLESDPSHPRFILTVWGVGYRFPTPEEIGQ